MIICPTCILCPFCKCDNTISDDGQVLLNICYHDKGFHVAGSVKSRMTFTCQNCKRQSSAILNIENLSVNFTDVIGLPTKEEAEANQKKFNDSLNAIQERIAVYLDKESSLIYSAYETENGYPVDNLDKIAVKGRCILFREADDYWGGSNSENYKSPILKNPTWLMVCKYASEMIEVVGDEHHVFLEGLDINKEMTARRKDGVKVYDFCMGS